MPELRFDTGLVTYKLNDTAEVSFNPTDAAFAERIYSAFETLDKHQEQYKAEAGQASGKRAIFDVARKWDREMRELIDSALGSPVCGELFGGMNVYAMSDGLPVWANLLLAILDEMDAGFTREQKASNPRIAKYTSKYRR